MIYEMQHSIQFFSLELKLITHILNRRTKNRPHSLLLVKPKYVFSHCVIVRTFGLKCLTVYLKNIAKGIHALMIQKMAIEFIAKKNVCHFVKL